MQTEASALHEDCIVIDAACPLAKEPAYLDWYREGGVTVVAPTVGGREGTQITMDRLMAWQRRLAAHEHLLRIQTASDIERAKRSGRLGIYLHFQGTEPIENDLDLIDRYKALGVGVVQLTYNTRNRVGDGCEEPTDAGLSAFGIELVRRLNQARVIVDCSHTGERTSLDAIEHSAAPVILSHSNASSVHASARNVSNELIKAIAQCGGVIGIAGFPALVAGTRQPSLDHFIAHIDAIVQLIGIDHVGLGIDYYPWQAGVATDEQAMRGYDDAIARGIWGPAYPPPPHHYPAGIETPRSLPNLTVRLLERGYKPSEVRQILGGNWLRVMSRVWG